MSTQTKASHTPGPWILKPYRKDFSIGISGESEYVVTVTGMSEKDKANARLIAAAPELLEACKDALESLKRLIDAEGAYRVTNISQLQSAIRKALGK